MRQVLMFFCSCLALVVCSICMLLSRLLAEGSRGWLSTDESRTDFIALLSRRVLTQARLNATMLWGPFPCMRVCVFAVPPSLSVICSLRFRCYCLPAATANVFYVSVCVCLLAQWTAIFSQLLAARLPPRCTHSINLRLMLCVWRGLLKRTHTLFAQCVARARVANSLCACYGRRGLPSSC